MKTTKGFTALAAVCMLVAGMFSCKVETEYVDRTPEPDKKAPAEVTDLQAVAGNGKVSLTWKNPADEDLYQVEISAAPADGALKNPVYVAAQKDAAGSFIAEGLKAGTAYTFTLKTIDKSLNKSKGVKTANAVKPIDSTDRTPPAEVTDLQAVAGNGKVSLTWKNPADEDLYQVEISASPADGALKNPVYVAAAKDTAGSFIAEGLKAGTAYTFTLKTIDKSLNKSKGVQSEAQQTQAGGSVMIITLTQSPLKETKTCGNVTVTVSSSTSIKEAKWLKGAKSAKEVFASGTAIAGSSFEASENGMYSVGVRDNDGRREVETIEIKNIDRTPPSPVTALTLGYSSASKTLTANWHNPTDADFAGLVLSWKKEGGTATEVPLSKEAESYAITNIEADGSKYIVSVKAKDDAGNESAAIEANVKIDAAAEITNVSLSRTHLDSEETDRNITVTVTGNNFNALTSLLVQVTDGSSSPVSASIDKAHNKATATVIAPVPSSPSDAGQTYTVKVIVNGSPVAQTATFKVTTPARVSAIQLSKNPIKFGTQPKVGVTVKGTNFDIRGETKIKLLDSNWSEVSTVTVAETEGTETEFSKELTLPGKSGYYTVAVIFKGIMQYTTETLQLYEEPVIESVFIQKAGISYGGNKLPETITGKNFKAPGVTAGDFSWSGAALSNFKIESDTLATAEAECPNVAGNTTVTVMCKTASKSGVLSVKDYGTGYEAGKIVLADKSLVEKDSYTAIDPSNPPVGVICGFTCGVPKMIALHSSESNLQWAKNGSTGYRTKFEAIICTPSNSESGAALTATFTGDTDGSDNWSYIKSKDAEGTADAVVAENYPAFNWVSQYNTKYADKLNNKKFDWYMPSLAELCGVYKNRTAINASLAKIHGLENGSSYVDTNLADVWYWSSSQSSANFNAWRVTFDTGNVYQSFKEDITGVCCLAGF
ncbi:MAG: DUF4959 domain-containing protein [Treponema sp.]